MTCMFLMYRSLQILYTVLLYSMSTKADFPQLSTISAQPRKVCTMHYKDKILSIFINGANVHNPPSEVLFYVEYVQYRKLCSFVWTETEPSCSEGDYILAISHFDNESICVVILYTEEK